MNYFSPKKKRKVIENGLKRTLSKPERRAQEEAFALAHRGDSDEQLYNWIKEEKRRMGDDLKRRDLIGYCYLTDRLGSWDGFMGRIGAELKEEKQSTKEKAELHSTNN